MSAARHLHQGQMSMFLPAHILVDPKHVEHYEIKYGYGGSLDELRAAKLAEAKTGSPENSRDFRRGGPTLRESIAQQGIKTPVDLYPPVEGSTKPELGEGHHRVFTAHDLNPRTEVPVRWKQDWED